jgi:hypothetical protein
MIDQKVFLEEISILMDWFNRDFESATLNRLHERLSEHLTTEEFKQAANVVFDTARFFPTVSDFVKASKGDPDVEALKAWDCCLEASLTGDYHLIDRLTPQTQFALRAVGGMNALRRIKSEDERWVKKEFVTAWIAWSAPSVGVALPTAPDAVALPQGSSGDVTDLLPGRGIDSIHSLATEMFRDIRE